MAIYTNLPIYKATYSLLLEVSRMMPDLPRDARYTIGQEMRTSIMKILIYIYRANRTRRKVHLIGLMREFLLEVQVYVRLLNDMKCISEKKYVHLMELTSDMSKQLAAWEKSEINRNSDGLKDCQGGNVSGQGF